MASAVLAEPRWASVEPIFVKRCTMCHSGEHAPRSLRLDSYEGAMAGSDRGPVVLPGDPSGSELVRRLRGEAKPRMPFLSYPLPSDEIGLVERWVEAGTPQ